MASQTVDLSLRTSGNVFAPSGVTTTYVNLPYDNSPSASNTTVFFVGSAVNGILISDPTYKIDSNSGFHTLFGGINVEGQSSDYTVSSWFGLVTLTHKTTGQSIQFQLTRPENPASNSGVNVFFTNGSIAFTSNVNAQGVWTVWGTEGGVGTDQWGAPGTAFQLPGTQTPGAQPVDLSTKSSSLNPAVNSSTVTAWYGYTLTTNIDTINVTGTLPETVIDGLQQPSGSTWNTGDTINGNGLTQVALTLNGNVGGSGSVVDANDLLSINVNLLDHSTLDTSRFDRVATVALSSGVASKALTLAAFDLDTTLAVSGAKNFTVDFDSFESTAGTNTVKLSAGGAGISNSAQTVFRFSDQAIEQAQLSTTGTNYLELGDSYALSGVTVLGSGANSIKFSTTHASTSVFAETTTAAQSYTFTSNSAINARTGAGDDQFDFRTTLSSADAVDGGGGSNLLSAVVASESLIRATGTRIQTVDLAFSASGTFQGDLFESATRYNIGGSSAAAAVTQVAASVTDLVIDASNSGSLSFAYNPGANASLAVSIGDTSPTTGLSVTTGNSSFTGVSDLFIRSVGRAANALGSVSASDATRLSVETESLLSDLTLGDLSATRLIDLELLADGGDIQIGHLAEAGNLQSISVVGLGGANLTLGQIGSLIQAERLYSLDVEIGSGNLSIGLIDADNATGTRPALEIVSIRTAGGTSQRSQQVSLAAIAAENTALDYYFNDFGDFVDADQNGLYQIAKVSAKSMGYVELSAGISSLIHYQGFSADEFGGVFAAIDSNSTIIIDRLTDSAGGGLATIGGIVVSGTGNFQLSAVSAQSVSHFDSTALSGKVTADFSEVLTGITISLGSGGTGTGSVKGSTGADIMTGGIGTDVLYGGAGADNITPGAGTDVVYSGLGNDTLLLTETVAASDDLYYLEAGSQNVDQVTGFNASLDNLFYKTTGNLMNNGVANVLRDTSGAAIASKSTGALSVQECAVNTNYSLGAGNVADALVFSSRTASSYAAAIGSGVITHAAFASSATGVISTWYDDVTDQAVFGYLLDSNADSTFTSQDVFVEVSRIGMAPSDYTLSNIKAVIGTF